MSHFSVMVISAEEPTDDLLTKVLAPWHEFECTGIDDEHVQNIDETAELRQRYAADESPMLRAPDGTLYDAYDDRFYRDQTPEERAASGIFDRGRKVRGIPDGYTEVRIPTRDTASFLTFIDRETSKAVVPFGAEPDLSGEHKYGYVLLTADGDVYKVIDRTNPNKKWDWWSVGGRWSGLLAPEYDPEADPANRETCFLCDGTGTRKDGPAANGCNGCEGTGRRLKHPSDWRQIGNIAQRRDIPVASLREKGGCKAGERWDKGTALVAGRSIPDFAALREEHGVEKARALYWADPVVKDLQQAGEGFLENRVLQDLHGSREAAVERGRLSVLATFAIVQDGQWFERGSMGWWGIISDEKDRDAWDREFATLLDSLLPETWVAIVDCHI